MIAEGQLGSTKRKRSLQLRVTNLFKVALLSSCFTNLGSDDSESKTRLRRTFFDASTMNWMYALQSSTQIQVPRAMKWFLTEMARSFILCGRANAANWMATF